jgi:DNA-binding NtrC family response regulator
LKRTHRSGRILIVDDEEKIRNILAAILRDTGYTVETAKDGIEAVGKSSAFSPDLLIVDLQMPRMDGMETIATVRGRLPHVVSIILTAHGSIQSAVQAIKQGVYDYITKPFDNEQMLLIVKRALEVHRLAAEVDELKKQLQRTYGIQSFIGDSAVMQNVRQEILQVAPTDATVLIEGESGTGKELAARAIHFQSKRREMPLVVIDCAAIPPNLIESEFFGHEKGAFTGAVEQRGGKFEEADGGTIFLDEIGELPLEAQTRLLRVLQEKEFNRIGSTTAVTVDVRIIAATNKNLELRVKEGEFREDLFYRLNVLKITMPALRMHREDIHSYVDHFLRKHGAAFGKNVNAVSPEALQLLENREWKGNIRELENAIQRALLNARGPSMGVPEFEFMTMDAERAFPEFDPAQGLEPYIKSLSERSERALIMRTLKETGWNRTEAAEKLKISRKTLFNKMRQYGLDSEDVDG